MDNKHLSYEFGEILNSQIQIFSSFYKVWGTKTAIMQKKTPSQFLFLSLQINMKLMDPTVISNFPPIIPEKWKGSILQEKGMLKPLNIQKKKYGKQDF